jgi:hypothetical protein
MAGMSPTQSNRPGLWSRLIDSIAGRKRTVAATPPLFRGRPVPPLEPRGPGLPELDDILLEAPRPPDPARVSRPTLVPAAPLVSAAAPPEPVAPAAPPRLTPVERVAAERIRLLIGSGMVAEAQALLDMHFAPRPDLLDRSGLPIHRIESYRIAAVRRDPATLARLAAELRPLLAEHDPLLEVIAARGAMRAKDLAAARAAWQAALLRAPGLTEAQEWLRRNPAAPEAGQLAAELIVPAPDPADRPRLPATPPPAAPAPLPPALPAGAPARLVRNVALRLAAGLVELDDSEAGWHAARDVAGSAPGEVALVLRGTLPPVRALAFTELALTLVTLCHAVEPRLGPARLYVGRQPWARIPVADSPAELLAVLFPGLRVVGQFDGTVREPTAVVLEPALRNAATETLIGGMIPLVARCAAAARAELFAAHDLPARSLPPRVAGRRPQALYLQPMPARVLAEPARQALFALLERAGFEPSARDLSTLPWREQLRTVHGADLLVGVHGPMLAAATAWTHPQARVLEFFPAGTRRYDTQLMAEAVGATYLGVEATGPGGFVARVRERFGPPRGPAGGTVEMLPMKLLERALLGPAAPAG